MFNLAICYQINQSYPCQMVFLKKIYQNFGYKIYSALSINTEKIPRLIFTCANKMPAVRYNKVGWKSYLIMKVEVNGGWFGSFSYLIQLKSALSIYCCREKGLSWFSPTRAHKMRGLGLILCQLNCTRMLKNMYKEKTNLRS